MRLLERLRRFFVGARVHVGAAAFRPRIARQGDVLVMAVTNLPPGIRRVPRDNGRIVLAYGEATGHAHAIEDLNVEGFMRNGTMFLRVTGEPATLRHEEHAPIELGPGAYEVRRQREYFPPDEVERHMAEQQMQWERLVAD